MKLQIRTLIVLAMACLVLTGVSQAGGYIGAGAGQGNTDLDMGGGFDETDTAFKVYGGYRFIKFFGVEADYRDFGAPANDTMEVDTTAFDVWAVGVVPIGKFEVFGKAGVTSWDADVSGISDSYDGNDLAFGIGGAFKISKIAVRLEFEQFNVETDVGDANNSMATVGVDWRF